VKVPSFKKLLVIVFFVTFTTAHTPVSAAQKYPNRIISLSPSATEDLFALGAGKQVIAVDDNSNYPSNAPQSKLSSFNPSAEAIAKYKPDFVIIQSSATKADLVINQLKALKIKVYVEHTPTDITGVYKEISEIANIVGKASNAVKLNSKIKQARATAISNSNGRANSTIFHELDNTLYSATSATFIGKIYADLGLKNIADNASRADDGGYPQLQNEYVISANPQYIFLADAQYGETAAKVGSRPGWSALAAVKDGKVVELPADISSRWGPRIINFYNLISNALS
jgi:iron complex transport system substrate-binding protein